MKIVIPGGSGQVGTLLARALSLDGHAVVVLSRKPVPAPWRVMAWDGATASGPWMQEIDGCDVVVNLAGKSVNCRYGEANRRAILESRVRSTEAVGQAVSAASRPPRVWLQASTATIYAHRYDAPNDEATGIIGGSEPDVPDTWTFSVDVARAWEQAFDASPTRTTPPPKDRAAAPLPGSAELSPRTRKIALRSAMTMSPDPGGIFDTLLGLTRRGLGGAAGDGRQYISWIHGDDFVRVVRWLIEREDVAGAVNVASPQPLPNREFMRTLRRVWGAPVGLPATRWMLEIGAFLMGTETELILKSRRVVPGRLLDLGFEFIYPRWDDAASDLCSRWRRGRNRSSRETGEGG